VTWACLTAVVLAVAFGAGAVWSLAYMALETTLLTGARRVAGFAALERGDNGETEAKAAQAPGTDDALGRLPFFQTLEQRSRPSDRTRQPHSGQSRLRAGRRLST
jgi:hypothetical protein